MANSSPSWRQALAAYLVAAQADRAAERLFNRAMRTTEKLARRSGGSDAAWARACNVVGVELADHRSLAARRAWCRAEGVLRSAVVAAVRGEPWHVRVLVLGAVRCAELPCPANDD